MKLFLSCDSTAVSVGAGRVAGALANAAGSDDDALELVRTGSRGLYWLEPLVELEHEGTRHGFGPVAPEDVARILAAVRSGRLDDPLYVGDVDALLASQGQRRVTFARCGRIDPTSWDDYAANGGLAGLRKALETAPGDIVASVEESGLRGRGGAGFPTGTKWRTVAETAGSPRYVVCNADEGDSGTFADRMLMEGDPLCLIEGMIIAGLAVGAEKGFIYLRSEYPDARRTLAQAIDLARRSGMLGASVLGSGRAFDVELRIGAGAYICGEETSLLESLEGKRGMIRYKPPLPALDGLLGCPTVMNNVITLATVPAILADGPEMYAGLGSGRSRGTLTVQLCGNVARPGLYELPFGATLEHLVNDLGGGAATGRPVRAVQVGGPLGAYFPVSLFDTPLDYEAFAAREGMLGHGGVVVFDDTVDLLAQARFAMEFCAIESCGKCTPCRIGSTRGVEVLDRIRSGRDTDANLALIEDLCEVMLEGSLCALGGLTPYPVRSALRHFPEDFKRTARAAATG
ncbi:MAG TPA: NADH-ubiquinone oxidoreductase-F iron-sulfur binding region domain-containing protein [Gammaproteobacteria bacterium]|nr:NADH-ubiquinone oxidoreductase-F iron-sulfur binding region domain-containing protein [Gammaproteobacteria bacterium]